MGSEPLAIPGTSKRRFFTSKTVARKPAEKNGGVEGTKDVAVFFGRSPRQKVYHRFPHAVAVGWGYFDVAAHSDSCLAGGLQLQPGM